MIQPGSLTPPWPARKGDQKAPLPLRSSSHKAEIRVIRTANSPTTLPWAAGKGLQQPLWTAGTFVAAGHHNLRVGLFPSSASKKAESSFLEPGPSTHDTTTGSLLWTTTTSPLFQPQGIFSTTSSTRVSPPMQIKCLCTYTSLILQNHLCFWILHHKPSAGLLCSKRVTYQDSAIAGKLRRAGSCF